MGVYIKGMEMPERGMVINIYANGRVTNHFDEFGEQIGTAVPVPPHGRLIDADALRKCGLLYREGMDVGGIIYVPMRDVFRSINTATTIIPAEEGNGDE